MALLNPYINLNGNARQAAEFYHGVFGGKLDMNTYAEFGQTSGDPVADNKIMHSQLQTDNGMTLMVSDAPPGTEGHVGSNISISLSGQDEAELRGYWDKLSEGATINMPLEQAPWGDSFGMLTDKFGVDWMVNIAGQQS